MSVEVGTFSWCRVASVGVLFDEGEQVSVYDRRRVGDQERGVIPFWRLKWNLRLLIVDGLLPGGAVVDPSDER